MTNLPKKPTDTAELIYKSYEAQHENCFREHLGASLIGDPCRRKLWYTFHGATRASFPGRVLRLFARGNDEELRFSDDLRAIGCTLHTVDPETGKQFRVSAHGGHFGGSMDGALVNLPEAPKTWHVVEMKTANDKSFKDLCKKGVQDSKPTHYAQMQVYMLLTDMKRALYIAVNKNDDSIYTERVRLVKKAAEALLEKAKTIIDAPEPLERISEKPDWYECRFCDHHAICHEQQVPEVHCRTCANSTAEEDGTWSCALNPDDRLSYEDQLSGCGDHLFIPALIPFAEKVGVVREQSGHTTGVEYKMNDGRTFLNTTKLAPAMRHGYTSKELQHVDPRLIADPGVEELRVRFDGSVTGS